MMIHNQLALANIFIKYKEIYESDKPHFPTLLENLIDLYEFVPICSITDI